jgi:transcriptional regulator with XRE-family HTH domain
MSDEFREWLTIELNRLSLIQRQFAKQAGLSSSLVNNVVAGTMPPSADFVITAGTTLGVNPVPLLRLAGHLPPEPPQGDEIDVTDLDTLTAIIRSLPPIPASRFWITPAFSPSNPAKNYDHQSLRGTIYRNSPEKLAALSQASPGTNFE